MSKLGLEARRVAVAAMTAVTEEGRLLGDVLPGLTAKLEAGDAARAGRLATEALRWADRSDRVLGPHLRLKPEEPVMNVLRLALYEMFEASAAHHAVVDAAVSLTKKSKAGLVNAVLRNVIRREVVWAEMPVPRVAKWLRKRLVKAWGKAAVEEMERVFSGAVPLDLSVKGGSADEWVEKLSAEALPTGSVRLREVGQVSALPGYAEGAWWVQDAGATLAAKVLAAKEGEHVLDLCAAPGGKTMQLAAAGARVTALDVSEKRMERVRENLERTGLQAEMVVADALEWTPDKQFDAILLDAPCSATGTLRRHPDLAYARDGSGVEALVALQADLLDRAVQWLKPGGRLVYCTCSLLPEEGEAQIEAALKRLPGLQVVKSEISGTDAEWHVPTGLRVRPDHWAARGGIDGFFVSRLEFSAEKHS